MSVSKLEDAEESNYGMRLLGKPRARYWLISPALVPLEQILPNAAVIDALCAIIGKNPRQN